MVIILSSTELKVGEEAFENNTSDVVHYIVRVMLTQPFMNSTHFIFVLPRWVKSNPKCFTKARLDIFITLTNALRCSYMKYQRNHRRSNSEGENNSPVVHLNASPDKNMLAVIVILVT